MRTLAISAAAVAAAALLAGCGGSSKPSSAPAAATTGASSFSAYQQCLSQHGVTLPSRRPRPSGSPGGGNGGGGFGGGFGGLGGASPNPTVSAAMQACASLRPAGRGGGFNSSAFAAYRSCLSDHGVVLPTPSPGAGGGRGGFGGLGGLNRSDPKVAAAIQACAPLLPTRAATPTPSSSPSA